MKLKVLAAAAGVLAAAPSYAQVTATTSTSNPATSGSYSSIFYQTDFSTNSSDAYFAPDLYYASTAAGGFYQPPAGGEGTFGYVAAQAFGGGTNSPATFNTTSFGNFDTVSFLWGSIDSFNHVEFLTSAGVVQTFTGAAFNGGVDGSVSKYVTFTVAPALVGQITGIRFSSVGDNAFEIDNLAIGAVPEASTWAMMILGLGMAGTMLRRRSTKTRVTFAQA